MQLFIFPDKQAGHLALPQRKLHSGAVALWDAVRSCGCIARRAPAQALKLSLVLGPATGNAPRKAQDQHGEDGSYGGRLENDGG
jgi:hypothetical protein